MRSVPSAHRRGIALRHRRVRRFEMRVDCRSTVCVLPPKTRPVGGVDPFGAGWVVL